MRGLPSTSPTELPSRPELGVRAWSTEGLAPSRRARGTARTDSELHNTTRPVEAEGNLDLESNRRSACRPQAYLSGDLA